MPRTVLPAGTRYNPRGTTKVLWIPLSSMPTEAAFTSVVLNGTTTVDITAALVPPITGFNGDQTRTPAPDMGSLKTGTVPGEITIGDSSLIFYLSKTGVADDIRSIMVQGDQGWLFIADTGLAVGQRGDLCRAEVLYGMKMREDLARITVPFSIATITENVAIPA